MPNKPQSGIYAPPYYRTFRCIADECRHCCCTDWDVYIDAETAAKYEQYSDIRTTMTRRADGVCFAMRADGRCPHLTDRGLCSIILTHGADFLPDICKHHPRFYNNVGGGRVEAGLGIACEEACRLVLTSETPFSLVRVGDTDADAAMYEPDFDALSHRDHILAVLAAKDTFHAQMRALQDAYQIADADTSETWLCHLLALETMDADWKRMLQSMRGKSFFCVSDAAYDKYFTRLFSYFVYRHVSVADNMLNLRARLAFAMRSVSVIRSVFAEAPTQTIELLVDIARRYSAEIEYSEENTEDLIFTLENELL